MALKKNIILEIGVSYNTQVNTQALGLPDKTMVTVNDTYVKVENVQSDKLAARANVCFYKNEKSFNAKTYEFYVNLDGSNFIKQAYEYLKTLPEFSGAVDC
jgi:hypothetical protein